MLILVVLGILILSFLYYNISHIFYPYDFTYNEGFNLVRLNEYVKTGQLYLNPENYPYIPNLYPPVYYLLSSPFIKLFGLSLVPLRLISFFSAILISLMIYIILKKETKDRYIPLICALFFLGNPLNVMYFVATVDLLAMFFSIAGLFSYVILKGKKKYFLSILFFVLAFYTKQNTLIALGAVVIDLLLKKRFKILIIYSSIIAFINPSILIVINYITKGEFIQQVFINTLKQDHSFSQLFFLLVFIIIFIYIFAIACVYLRKSFTHLFSIYFIVVFISTIFFITKKGSDVNYLLEPLICLTLLFGLSLSSLNKNRLKSIYSLFFVYLILLFIFQIAMFATINHPLLISIGDTRLTDDKLSDLVRNNQGRMILIGKSALALENGGSPAFEEFEIGERYKYGYWNSSNFYIDCKTNFTLVGFRDAQNPFKLKILYSLNPLYNSIKTFHMIDPLNDCLSNGFIRLEKIGDYTIYKKI
jgi:4-amino-4-deoxy-L-arabinose transferase-like glycosyltransferase